MNPFKYSIYDIKSLLFLALFTFPALPILVCNWIFIFFSISVLLEFFIFKHKIIWNDLKFYLVILLPFLPYLVELLFFPDNPVIRFEAEKKILFFIAPLVFYFFSQLQIKIKAHQALFVFSITVSIVALSACMYLLLNGFLNGSVGAGQRTYLIRTAFEEFSHLHPSYFGLFCTFSALWLMHSFNKLQFKYKPLALTALLSLVGLNLLLASKMALFILIIGMIWLLWQSSIKRSTKVYYFTILIISMFTAAFFIPSLNDRLSELQFTDNAGGLSNTLVERKIIYNCNMAIIRTDIVMGSGARNAQSLLDYCYSWCGYDKGAIIHLNSHNQYFTLTLNYGILILIVFIGSLAVLILKSNQSNISKLFWVSVLLMMLSESLLERQMGVYYFLFFAYLFLIVQNQNSLPEKVKE